MSGENNAKTCAPNRRLLKDLGEVWLGRVFLALYTADASVQCRPR